jgi:hypothetical protein
MPYTNYEGEGGTEFFPGGLSEVKTIFSLYNK